MNRRLIALGGCAALVLAMAGSTRADWLIKTWSVPTTGTIRNYATADALISGTGLAFSQASPYSLANTQDNGGGGGSVFGSGTQIVGLPGAPTDTNDFAFVGTGTLTVATAGSYTFYTNTDDGSRLRGSVNGGAVTQVIADDVLSGDHEVASPAIPLAAGDSVAFDWMWFEAGGGAEGKFYYSPDGGTTKLLIGDPAGGLSLNGGSLNGTVYKSTVVPGMEINNFATAQAVINTPGSLKGQGLFPTVNVLNDAPGGGDGDFSGGVNAPGVPIGADDFVVIGTGYLNVAPGQQGSYIFRSNTDDGGRLRIDLNADGDYDDAGELVIDHDALQGPTNTDSAPVTLPIGYFPIEYMGTERGGGAEFEVSMRPNLPRTTFALIGNTAGGALGVVQPVPEPSTVVLMLVGAVGLFVVRRKKAA